MRIPRRLYLVTYGMPVAVVAAFFAAMRLPRLVPEASRIFALWGCFAVAVMVTAAVSYLLASRVERPLSAARIALAPVMLVASSYAMFLYVERDISRVLVAALAAGLAGAHAAFVAGLHAPARYKIDDLKHIAFAVRVVASFCAFVYAFALPTVSRLPPASIVAAVAVWVTLVTWETLNDEGLSLRPPLIITAAFAVLAAEFHAGLSVLPLTPYVNGIVALTLLVSALTTTILALRGAAPPRRNFVIAAVTVIVVLATAHWY